MEQIYPTNKSYEPLLHFTVHTPNGRKSFAQHIFPTGAGSFFRFFIGVYDGITANIPPQTKLSFKLDFSLFWCFDQIIQNITYGAKRLKEGFYMKKLISRWFTIKSNKELEALQFRKDEEGKDIFYPWGYPGESYHLTKLQKKIFDLCGYTAATTSIIILMAVIFLHRKSIINFDTADTIVYGYLLAMPIFYLFGIYVINKTSKPYVFSLDNRVEKNIWGFWFLFVSPILILSEFFAKNSIYLQYNSPAIWAVIYTVGALYFIYKIKKTKGYIFNK